MLLGAVVNIALDSPPLVVGGGHDPQPGGLQLGQPRAELLGQPDVAQDQTRLGREIGHQLALNRGETFPRPFGRRQRAERFPLVVDEGDPVGPGDRRHLAVAQGRPPRRPGVSRPAGTRHKLGAIFQPHRRAVGTRAFSKDPGHPGKNVFGGVGTAHPPGELAQRLIRRGPLAEHQPVGQVLHPFPDRLEGHRHHRGRQYRQAQVGPRAGVQGT